MKVNGSKANGSARPERAGPDRLGLLGSIEAEEEVVMDEEEGKRSGRREMNGSDNVKKGSGNGIEFGFGFGKPEP